MRRAVGASFAWAMRMASLVSRISVAASSSKRLWLSQDPTKWSHGSGWWDLTNPHKYIYIYICNIYTWESHSSLLQFGFHFLNSKFNAVLTRHVCCLYHWICHHHCLTARFIGKGSCPSFCWSAFSQSISTMARRLAKSFHTFSACAINRFESSIWRC